MQTFKLTPFRPHLAQAQSSPSIPSPVPPPDPTFTGLPSAIESLAVVAILSASAWASIRVGLGTSATPIKAAGWVGGIGSAVLGLLYLGTKVGVVQDLGLPAIRVTPT
jgi:hypothetical protein